MTHTKNQIIIGITGLAGSGKDTVRAILESEHAAHGLAFADPMRSMIAALFTANGIDAKYMLDRSCKEAIIPGLGVSYRHMAQTMGTQWGRDQLGSEFWVGIAKSKIRDLNWQMDRPGVYCISDVRFENEAAMVREFGGVIWRVVREQAAAVRPHVSESEPVSIKPLITIYNNGSIDDLRDVVREAFTDTACVIHSTKGVSA